MTTKTVDGEEIDVESPAYQRYLRQQKADEEYAPYPEPAPYRTMGEVVELERRRRVREAQGVDDVTASHPVRETVPA